MTWIMVATVTMGVGTAVNVYGQLEAGKAQQDALNQQAEQQKIAAESRELERQQKLGQALAANTVGLAAGNVGMEGTPSSIALESAQNIGMSEGMLKLSDRLAQAQLKRQGRNARSASQLQAAGTLLTGVSSAASLNA